MSNIAFWCIFSIFDIFAVSKSSRNEQKKMVGIIFFLQVCTLCTCWRGKSMQCNKVRYFLTTTDFSSYYPRKYVLETSQVKLLEHPPYLPDLEPSDLFWCTTLKQVVLYAIQKEWNVCFYCYSSIKCLNTGRKYWMFVRKIRNVAKLKI